MEISGVKTYTQRGKSENTRDANELKKMLVFDGKSAMLIKLNPSSEHSQESKVSEDEKTVGVMTAMVQNGKKRGAVRKEAAGRA